VAGQDREKAVEIGLSCDIFKACPHSYGPSQVLDVGSLVHAGLAIESASTFMQFYQERRAY